MTKSSFYVKNKDALKTPKNDFSKPLPSPTNFF